MSALKHVLLDTNILVNYYEHNQHADLMHLLHTHADQHRALLHISNVCIAEIFKVFAAHCYDEHRLSEERYWTIKETFSREVTRSFRYTQPHRYHELKLTAYHIVHADLVFRRAMEYQKTHPQGNKFVSTVDLLLLAQGIEMNHLYGYDNVLVLTGDKLLYDIGTHLRAHDTPDEKAACIMRHPPDNVRATLATFRYPRVECAHATHAINNLVAFLGNRP